MAARLGSSTAVKEAVKSGLGISILSTAALEVESQAGLIVSLRIKDLFMSRNFYLIRDKRRTASPLCQSMLNFLKETQNV